ncbi:MAG TPA: heme exporter protein CcmD [Casimicrobiaceae bacterium]|nr:heme exporter protein CcmD [Casimicrobiaceae bacterium]
MSEFFYMGGYAWYVWMAYGAFALAIVIEVLALRARRRRAIELLRATAAADNAPRARLNPARST